MSGRHRRGAGQQKSRHGAAVGSAGAVLLLCGALVYAVGAVGSEPVKPDPLEASSPANTSLSRQPEGTPTLAMPMQTPGADMRRQPVTRQSQARPTVPATTSAPARERPEAKPTKPRVRRSGKCYVYSYNGADYVFCPGRSGRPRR